MIKIKKFADSLKEEIVHKIIEKIFLIKKNDINKYIDEEKDKPFIDNNLTIRDLYIIFGENMKTLKIDDINKFLSDKNELKRYINKLLNLNDKENINISFNNINKIISKKELLSIISEILISFFDKYKLLFSNKENKHIWIDILKNNAKQKKETFLITDLRFKEEIIKEAKIIFLYSTEKNNYRIKEELIFKNLNNNIENNKLLNDYKKVNNLESLFKILKNKYLVKNSEELSITLLIFNHFKNYNIINHNIEKELNSIFNNNNFYIFNNKVDDINNKREIFNLYKNVKDNNIIEIIGPRRSGKDYIANYFIYFDLIEQIKKNIQQLKNSKNQNFLTEKKIKNLNNIINNILNNQILKNEILSKNEIENLNNIKNFINNKNVNYILKLFDNYLNNFEKSFINTENYKQEISFN